MLVLTGTTDTTPLALHWHYTGTAPDMGHTQGGRTCPHYHTFYYTLPGTPRLLNTTCNYPVAPSVINREYIANRYLLKILNSTITVLCSSCNAFDPRLDIRSNFCEDIWGGVRQIPVASACQSNNRIPISSRYKI